MLVRSMGSIEKIYYNTHKNIYVVYIRAIGVTFQPNLGKKVKKKPL